MAWCRDVPVALQAAPEALVIELRPAPAVRRMAALLRVLLLLYAGELLLTHHWLAALAMGPLAALSLRPWGRRSGAGPRQLLVSADGALWLAYGDVLVRMHLDPSSLRFGSQLLLVMRGAGGTHRLLLGPGNVAPQALAALRRRLVAGPAGPGTALHSFAAQGSQPSDPA